MSSPNAPITGVVRLRGTHARASSSSNTLSHRPHLRPSARHHVYEAESPNREEHDVDPSEGPFPFKAYEMLEDKALTTYVQWHQERGSHGLLIPNIGAFVEYALPKHFPGVKKSTTQAFYTHWNNKFRQGHPELLPEVTRRPDRGVKTSTRQDAVQKQPATTPDSGSQPLNLLELQEWINRLENDFNEIKNENIQIRNENNQLKRENNHLKNEVLELKYRQSASEGRLDKVETQLQDVMRELSARSVGGGLLNSVGDPGLGVLAFNNNFRTNEAGNHSGILDGFMLKPQIGAYDGGNSQALALHPRTSISNDTINPALLGQPSHRQSSGFDLAANPGIFLSYSSGHSAPGGHISQPFLMQGTSQNSLAPTPLVDPIFRHPQTSIPSISAPSFAHNAPTVTFTNQSPTPIQASGSRGFSSRRGPLGAMLRVPPLPPPNGPSR
ncbi:hypothetical protein M407DRAFT_24377 [Tulasnella calospora MUT 4182]|uniref:HSF-type DNA-binding domain-containing protein n=1 Tax=Tulasnella calospora MUT 4182 TaxID=1051891 RepID=A0A0C3LXT3_9AGAM|nr:hypothetical protein M407DRAFT_24377 [Tulasnella calospora MUT 4182]